LTLSTGENGIQPQRKSLCPGLIHIESGQALSKARMGQSLKVFFAFQDAAIPEN
jgi:hypothetical protein